MSFIIPDWPAPEQVKSLSTCRDGGVSEKAFSSFNVAQHVGDEKSAVSQNRNILINDGWLPSKPVWLNQVHGTTAVELDNIQNRSVVEADASIARSNDLVCAVMTADCLPILLCKKDGSAVAAIHAGWRGLLSGVIENTIERFGEAEQALAWLGPAIGPGKFEVGSEIKDAFAKKTPVTQQAFQQVGRAHYMADLYALARMTLLNCGVKRMYGGEHCTYNQSQQFYSYRREPVTGRMASLIWLQS